MAYSNRATYQKINPNLHCGKRVSRVTANDTEQASIRRGINAMKTALEATNEAEMLAQLSEAYRRIRQIVRSRSDV